MEEINNTSNQELNQGLDVQGNNKKTTFSVTNHNQSDTNTISDQQLIQNPTPTHIKPKRSMISIILAIILFLYAAWQLLTFLNTYSNISKGQGLGQIAWALIAILLGVYLLKRKLNKTK